MVSKEQVCVKEVSSSGLGCDGLGNKGQFSHGSTKGKPNSNSVKGKKEFARSKAIHLNSPQSDCTKEIKSSSTEWTLSICSVKPDQNDGFKFGADQHRQRGYGEFESVDGGVGSSPHSQHDSVQANASLGVEDCRAGLVKNGRDEDDHEKDRGGQHPTNIPGDMDGYAIALCVIKVGQRPDDNDEVL
nr:hypothetical protein CFP56_67430 [Quercus suber]